ncbi:MAG: cytochrome oxidase assembly protein [Pirellula sp.]|nr:cytochrome oxidase assembly protein [Pirellula sp.]
MSDTAINSTPSRLPHRLATLLVCAVFPLIWVGGLVTSTDAGMAVPDWPNTYGYNMFLYPLDWWITGPWDIFVEHGHRLFGALVGLLTIALCWSLWKKQAPAWLQRLAWFSLGFVILQGVLGGMRVVLGKQMLAMVHGCVGPLFFALSVALWHFTSSKAASTATAPPTGAAKLFRLALITTLLAYLQLVLGAVVRHTPHMPESASPGLFRIAVLLHLFMAAVLTVHVVSVFARSRRVAVDVGMPSVFRPATFLLIAIVLQLTLGAGTWVVNYGIPDWAQTPVVGEYVVRTRSPLQTDITTAHVAVGSLIFVTSLIVTLRAKLLCGQAVAGRPLQASSAAFLMSGFMLRGAAT